MTFIQGRGRPCRERIFEAPSEPSLSAESDYEGAFSPIVDSGAGSVGLFIAKYIEEDPQQILKAVLEAQVPTSNKPHEKLLKARLPNVYCSKSHIECYNICQQCEDHFATAGAKCFNRILFATSFLYNRINF